MTALHDLDGFDVYGNLSPADGWVELNGYGLVDFARWHGTDPAAAAERAGLDPRRVLAAARRADRAFTVAELDRLAVAVGIDDPRAIARDPRHYLHAVTRHPSPTRRHWYLNRLTAAGADHTIVGRALRDRGHRITNAQVKDWETLTGDGPPDELLTDLIDLLGADPTAIPTSAGPRGDVAGREPLEEPPPPDFEELVTLEHQAGTAAVRWRIDRLDMPALRTLLGQGPTRPFIRSDATRDDLRGAVLRAVRDTAAADAYLQQPPLADRVAEILADLGIDPERTAAAAADLIDVVERDLVDRVATHTTRQRRHSD